MAKRSASSGYEDVHAAAELEAAARSGLYAPAATGEGIPHGEVSPPPAPPAAKPKRRLMSSALQFMASIERRLEQFDPKTQKRILDWFRSTPDPEADHARPA